MAARLKSILVCVFAISLVSALCAGQPRDVSFVATYDQSEQRYVLLLPEAYDSAQSHDLLVCLHGHGADRWQFVQEERGEARAARVVATQQNMILVSPDYRATTSWMGPAAEADLVQIIHDLRKQHVLRRLVLSGASMGATSALTFTALHPDLVDGVVAFNGHANHLEYTNLQEAIQIAFGGNKGFFRNVPVICNWLQMKVLRAEVQQNPWKRGFFSIRPQGGASWGSKLAPLLV
jgi:pimeloyl-ACP methyl ester carboxylesterase